MWWECSECGCRVRGINKPSVCRECGLATSVFLRVEDEASFEPGGGALRELWLERGMSRAWEQQLLGSEAGAS